MQSNQQIPQPTLLPFDLAKALAGAPVVTRDGHEATEITKDHQLYPVRAVVEGEVMRFTERGEYYREGTDRRDLFLLADSAQEAGATDLKGGDAACAKLETNRNTSPVSDRPAEVQPLSAGQRDPNDDDELKAAREELAELKKGAKINTHVRLFDLVRYSRCELHNEGLITDEEYAWLCAEAPMSKSPKGGSPSRQRLEDYDELRAKLTTAETHAKALEGLLARVFGYAKGKIQPEDGWEDWADVCTMVDALLRPAAGPEVQP